jgi:hypothetical protein
LGVRLPMSKTCSLSKSLQLLHPYTWDILFCEDFITITILGEGYDRQCSRLYNGIAMTIHSRVKYKCESCDTPFVPIPEAPNCPKCLYKSDTVFPDFIKDTIDSAQFNLSHYAKFATTWLTLGSGDSYYYLAFQFLDYVCSELKLDKYHLLYRGFSKAQADLLASRFLNQLKESESYWKHGLATYLSLLLQRGYDNHFLPQKSEHLDLYPSYKAHTQSTS